MKKRTTVYLDDKLIKLMKIRSIKFEQSMSEYISQVVYQDLEEQKEDLKDIQKIIDEPTMSFDEVLKKLNVADKV